jgi:hypothetical protein
MSQHIAISATEAADRRHAKGQMALFTADTHLVGQSAVFTLTDDRATGEAYCLAHHVTVDRGKRSLMLASLRYYDTFMKIDGGWLFWVDERALP